jgi:hypothetical protein
VQWILDNVAGALVVAAILAALGLIGRYWIAGLWRRRPWPRIRRAPRTEAETRRLLAMRPDRWEYLLLAGSLYQELAKHADRYRDHEAGYVPPSGMTIPDDGFSDFLSAELDTVQTIIRNWTSLLSGTALANALAEAGEPGAADRIQHVAYRLTSAYADLIDWSARLLGATRPDRYRRLVDIVARLADQPIQQYRAWVAEVVEQIDRVPALLADRNREEINITLTLTLSISDEVEAELNAEMDRIRALGLMRPIDDDDFDQLT